MIELRANGFPKIGFTIQVDTLCHKIPNFIEKASQAGVRRVFIGLENINPDNLIAANKRQNKITDYREMLQKWRTYGAITCAGYIIGFPGDTKESILRDIEIIKSELPLDLLELSTSPPCPVRRTTSSSTKRGVDGSGHEQIRSESSRHSSFQNERHGMGRGTAGRLGQLLQPRPYPHDPSQGRRQPERPARDNLSTLLWFKLVILTKAFIRSKAARSA